jgi:hypothetical protein
MEDPPARAPGAGGAAVIYLNCPCCGLTVTAKTDWLAVEHCPRCIARRGVLVRLFASTLPAETLYAEDVRPDPDRFAAGGDHPATNAHSAGVSSEPGEDGARAGP